MYLCYFEKAVLGIGVKMGKSKEHMRAHTHTHMHVCAHAQNLRVLSLVLLQQCVYCFVGFLWQQGIAGVLTISQLHLTVHYYVCVCVCVRVSES